MTMILIMIITKLVIKIITTINSDKKKKKNIIITIIKNYHHHHQHVHHHHPHCHRPQHHHHQGSSQILSDVKFDSTIHKLWILIAEFIYIMLHPHSSSLLMVQYPILVLWLVRSFLLIFNVSWPCRCQEHPSLAVARLGLTPIPRWQPGHELGVGSQGRTDFFWGKQPGPFPLKMVIFHSYVSLPEGSPQNFGANRVNVPKKKKTLPTRRRPWMSRCRGYSASHGQRSDWG